MRRINVYATIDSYDDVDNEGTRLAGWFDLDKAETFAEKTDWDGNNHISRATGSQWNHEELCRTAKGRWVLHSWSQWQGSLPTYEFIDDAKARDWLITNDEDEAAEKYFDIEEERGPGRPEVGGAVHVRLGEQLAELDAWATAHGMTRAKAIREAVSRLVRTEVHSA